MGLTIILYGFVTFSETARLIVYLFGPEKCAALWDTTRAKHRFGRMVSTELTCRELVELVTDYLEDMLPQVERMRFEEHLTTCAGCRNYLVQMRRTIDTLGRLTEDDLAPVARDELLQLFRNWKFA